MNPIKTNPDNNDVLSLSDIIKIVWNRKWLLIIITFVGLVLAIGVGVYNNSKSSKVSTFVELQWDGLVRGQYPDGQTFNYASMFESYVYQQALSERALNTINTNKLRNAIEITPIIPNSILEIIENELRNGNQISYYATEYKITLKNGALNISVSEGQALLNEIILQFRADFERKYIASTKISNYLIDDYSRYDYLESLRLLESQIAMIKGAIDVLGPNASNFVSTQVGLSFDDILIRTYLVENIELNSIASRIDSYLLSKDKTLLTVRLNYENEVNKVALDKQNDIKAGLDTMIANYPGSTVTIIVAGTTTTETLKIDPYLDTIYKELVKTNMNIAELTNDIAYNTILIERYKGNDPSYSVTEETQNEQKVIVEEKITQSNLLLTEIVQDLDIMMEEYKVYSTRNLIRPLSSPQYESSVNYLYYAIIGLMMGGATGLIVVFVQYNTKKNKAI